MSVDEHTIELAGSPVFLRSATWRGVPALYLHGVPTSSLDWVGFLERTPGIAPDLIGFGRSAKGGHLDYSVEGLATAVDHMLAELEVERMRLVGHDWGALVALELAARHPERIEAVVLCNPLALVDGFRWPGLARMWRRPLLGELLMGATNRWLIARTLHRGSVRPDAWPEDRIATVWHDFDQGTQRAILRLYRRTHEHRLESERAALAKLEAPVLVLWGEQDPWLPVALGDRFASLLRQARLERVAGAGHWPWLDRPEVVEQAATFLESS